MPPLSQLKKRITFTVEDEVSQEGDTIVDISPRKITFTMEGEAATALLEMAADVGTINKKQMAERIAVFIHISILTGQMYDAAMAILGVEFEGVESMHSTVSRALNNWTNKPLHQESTSKPQEPIPLRKVARKSGKPSRKT